MIQLNEQYNREDFIDFLQKTFLPDYVRDIRSVGTNGLGSMSKATSLGGSDSLDLQVFEFEYAGSANKRVALTKEAFRIMKQSATFHALAVFYGQDSDDWRLSFMTANPERTEQGKVTVGYSNPRRFSFFLGPNAKINTANRFLIKDGQIKNFDDLLSRFNVEIVTKEFFENYKKLFDRLVRYLNKDHAFQSFAGRNGVETANFAKKLLGQIVFLYFLQRKGWLGAKKGDSISMGNKDFLRSLFSKSIERKENFYNTYLEPLFYGALNKYPEKAGSYYRSYFDCQVPFLNGGLFEPPQDFDWEHEFLMLPDKLFSKNPNDPTHGDGILDTFDLYNFTVDESDFLDKEVSVDPEMLGKVFENLLEENLRKGKGTYYTPREIVNYMCEESIVNYLTTETGLSSEDIKNKYFPAYNVLGDEKFEVRDVSISEQIIESLKNIKIVDPACGSGAFLVGMLQQITHLRYDLEGRSKLLGRRGIASSEYEIKKQTIQNCVYGVDIDPGAVDIAKLRLWLSLVVDYDLEEIEPLPNLDYKIMQGNSLLEELVLGDTTVKLYDRQAIQKALGSKKMKTLFEQESQVSLFDGENDKVLKTMRALQLKYFSTSDSESKKKIRDQIDKIEYDLIDVSVRAEAEQLSAQKLNIRSFPGIGLLPEDAKRLMNISSKESQIMAMLDELKKTGTKPFFLWHLYFADVFEEKGGFDVVIGNPPYGSDVKGDLRKAIVKHLGKVPDFEIYYFFLEKGRDLLSRKGFLAYIIPNTFLFNVFANQYRKKLLIDWSISAIIDCTSFKLFESATVFNAIVLFKKDGSNSSVGYKNTRTAESFSQLISGETFHVNQDALLAYNQNWGLVFRLPKDILGLVSKIKSVSTGLQTQFPDISQGLIAYDKYRGQSADIIEKRAYHYSNKVRGDLKAWLHGEDVRKYLVRWNEKEWIDYSEGIANPRQPKFFKGSRLLVREITNPSIYTAFTDQEFYNDPSVIIILDNPSASISLLYALALLNSSLATFYHFNASPKATKGGFPKILVKDIQEFPLKIASEKDQENIIKVVNEILSNTQSDNYLVDSGKQSKVVEYQKQIDQMIYKLYDLTQEEIKIVED